VHLPRSVSQRALRVGTQGARPLSELAGLGLTGRQIEVLGLVAQGLRNKEIARELGISEIMVKKHITPALQALGVPDRTKLLVTLNAHGYAVGVGRAM
jgi:DNA-binding NarL/FixJ family response regulator